MRKLFMQQRLFKSFLNLNENEGTGGGSSTETDPGDGKGGGTGGGDDKDKKPPSDTVSREEFNRVMQDLHKQKEKNRKYEQDRESEKTTRMKEQNQWKELAEAKERENDTLKTENKQIKDSFLNEKKFNEVKSKCAALGLRPEALSDLEMLDLEAVTVETTSTGKVNILGADKFAERLKAMKPHWFADPKAPKVNTDGTRVLDGSTTITARDLLNAEAEGKKTGNMGKYHELHKKYQQQRSGKSA